MKNWWLLPLCCGMWLASACSDDESTDEIGGDAGRGGGPSADAGATNEFGGAGADSGGTNGGAGGTPAQCDAPEPASAGTGGAAELALTGRYTDSFGGEHDITSARWQSGSSVYQIAAFDNEGGWIVAQNAETNAFFPCSWSRFDWTRSEGKLYFCQTAYNATSEREARETPAADASDPAVTGCGSFAWSELAEE